MPNRSPVLASAVQVRFQNRRCSGSVDDTVPLYYVKSINLSSITLSIPGEPSYSGHPGYKTFNDSALGLFNVGAGAPSNQAALDMLAKQIAQDFYDYRSISFDKVFNGVIKPLPNGLVDIIEWIYHDEDATTRLVSPPFNDGAEELCHMDPANPTCTGAAVGAVETQEPCFAAYGPPFLCSSFVSGSATAMYPVVTRYLYCLEDGRMKQTYIQKDVIK